SPDVPAPPTSTVFPSTTLFRSNPGVAVDILDASLSDSDNNSQVTFTFSEQVSDATVANLANGAGITVVGGTLSALSWNAAHTIATRKSTRPTTCHCPASVTVFS